jgi:pimeloyl-ACP methyl ester carboxylesterase
MPRADRIRRRLRWLVAGMLAGLVFLTGCTSSEPADGVATVSNPSILTHFKNAEYQYRFMGLYDQALRDWAGEYTEHHVATEFGPTYVIECGTPTAPPLVLLHWFSYNSTIWAPMIPYLADSFHLFAVDVIGDMGRSNALTPPKTDQELAQWAEQVITCLGLERVNLVGFSNGGFTAATIAREHPEIINQLVLMAPAATIDRFSFVFFTTVFRTALFPNSRNIERFKRRFTFHPERWVDYMEGMLTIAFTGSQIQVKVWPRVFTDEELGRLTMPVLLLVGENERIYRSRRPWERAMRVIPQARVEVLEECSHAISLDQPERASRAMVEFLLTSD